MLEEGEAILDYFNGFARGEVIKVEVVRARLMDERWQCRWLEY